MKTVKNLSKIAVYLLAGIILVITIPFTVLFLLNGNTDFSDTLEANWNILLSDDAGWEVIYQADEGASFHGDGIRYHVIAYENEDAISNMVNWTNREDTTRWYSGYRDCANAWLDEIRADETRYPQYDACKYYYQQKSDETTLAAIEEGRKIAHDSNVKGYTNMADLKAALDE